MNTVATGQDVDFRMTGYYWRKDGFPEREADEINRTCDAFLCPLADMFSENWSWYVRALTDLVRRLRIPCVVPCVGARDLPDGISPLSVPFASDVRGFMSAVLDKSSLVGVRGETTARFLEALGFVRGRHFEVLGCPTLYMYGQDLPIRPLRTDFPSESCAFSMNVRAPESSWLVVDECARLFGRSTFVSQDFREFHFFMLTHGKWSADVFDGNPYYRSLLSGYAEADCMRFFLNRKPWMDFLSTVDFYIGHRIHGALLAILAGTPAAVVPFESRTRELAEFHGVPVLDPSGAFQRTDAALALESLDFSGIQCRQDDNFPRYADFFRKNGIPTVFDGTILDRLDYPLERSLPERFPDDGLHAWQHHSRKERLQTQLVRYLVQAKRKLRK